MHPRHEKNTASTQTSKISNEQNSGLQLRPLPRCGERFPVDDPHLEPILTPRPVSDSLYLHGLLEGLTQIEHAGWQRLTSLGADPPRKIVTLGGGARNPQWRRLRERQLGVPIRSCGGVSGFLHISEISHEHIETPHSVLNVNDQMKVMIIDLDAERGRISLSTKALEPEPGDMLTDPQKVFDKAEEMAARYKQMLLEQAEEGEEPLSSMMV